MTIEVNKIIEDNVNEIKDITMTHSYDKETKTLSFKVRRTKGTTSRSSSTSTTHPKYKYGME